MPGQTIILHSSFQRGEAHRLIDAAPDRAVVKVEAPRRSVDQNARMWADLSSISRAKPEGRNWPPETWKAAFMQYLGHEIQWVPGLAGQPLPVGFRTSRLSKEQMSDLIEVIHEFAARHNIPLMESDT